MKKCGLRIIFVILAIAAGISTCAEKQSLVPLQVSAAWKVSTQEAQWRDGEALTIYSAPGEQADIRIDPSSLRQEIDGFGGAFNEKGWVALSLLTPAQRDAVLKELFDPADGARMNICRVPIGASDYAVSRYTMDEAKNDYEMKHFSIERDKKYLIPYIKAAMKYRPDLKIWGSDWTPPSWMKTNDAFDGGNMKDDPRVYEAYALYLARFAEDYRKQGIDVFAVAVQNEPLIETHYPSCLWTPLQFLVFIRDYMGPLFQRKIPEVRIMLGTLQDADYNKFPRTVLTDKDAAKYVSLVGFQWDGLAQVAQTKKNFPDKRLMQTETECGNWFWRPDFKFDLDKPQNDWAYGSYTWKKIKDFFAAGVNSYMLWNIVLDEEGKNIDARRPWPQNAAVVVDKHTKQVTYTPMYYAFKHFSYFVEPGAHYVDIVRGDEQAAAFINTDGRLVIELENSETSPSAKTISIGDYRITVTLPAQSWSTIIVPPLQ
jgi:glucosylceramidase